MGSGEAVRECAGVSEDAGVLLRRPAAVAETLTIFEVLGNRHLFVARKSPKSMKEFLRGPGGEVLACA